MSTIKEHLAKLLTETHELAELVTSADEFVAVSDIEKSINDLELVIHEARKTFERTKEVEE